MLLWLLWLLWARGKWVEAHTQADILNLRYQGEFSLLKATLEGDIDALQNALTKVNNVDIILTKEIGEKYLKLGTAGIDFPLAPALHLAILGGTHAHLRVAHRLIISGADLNYFNFNESDLSFPPPVYFGLGAFSSPTSAQAGILYAIFRTYSDRFRYSAVHLWVRQSGYPPPLHTCILYNNIDGIFVLSSIPNYDMDERDRQSLTALHVAAWLGNYVHVVFLIQRGANPLARDNYNRTFLHYCAIRGISSIPALLLNNPGPLSDSVKSLLMNAKDNDNNTALDISNHLPSQIMLREVFEEYLGFSSDYPVDDWSFISSFNGSDLSSVSFRQMIQSKQRPTIITHNLTSSLHVWSFVWNQTAFLEKYSTVEANVSAIDNQNNPSFYESTIEYLLIHNMSHFDKNRSGTCSSLVATLQSTLQIYEDFASNYTREFFGECGITSPKIVRIYLGNMTGLTLRSHSAAWNVHVKGGTRMWYFISPGTALDLVTNELRKFDPPFDINNPLHPEFSFHEWERRVLPVLQQNKLVSTVEQKLGDVIYIPHGWSYAVISSTETIDVTTIICESPSFSVFHQTPIGVRLYGQESSINEYN